MNDYCFSQFIYIYLSLYISVNLTILTINNLAIQEKQVQFRRIAYLGTVK